MLGGVGLKQISLCQGFWTWYAGAHMSTRSWV